MSDSKVNRTFLVSCPRCLNRRIHCCNEPAAGYDHLAIFTCQDCFLHFSGILAAEHGRIRMVFRKLDCPMDGKGHRLFRGGCFCRCAACMQTTETVYFTFYGGSSAYFAAEMLPYQESPNTSNLSIYLPHAKGKSSHLCVETFKGMPVIACNGQHACLDIVQRGAETAIDVRKIGCPSRGRGRNCCECECISCERHCAK